MLIYNSLVYILEVLYSNAMAGQRSGHAEKFLSLYELTPTYLGKEEDEYRALARSQYDPL